MIRWRRATLSGVLVAAVTASLVLVNVIAARVTPRLDVTATGEHRLAPRTTRLIERLEGEYEIVAAVNRAAVEPNAYRQVRDVLGALDASSPLVRTTEIDTGRADGLERYQDLVERLVERDRGALDAYRTRVGDAIGGAREVATFLAQQVAPSLENLRDAIPDSAPSAAVNREAFGQRGEVARLAARELAQLADQAEKTLGEPGVVPRPDRAGAVVLPGLDGVGSQLAALADELAAFAASESQPQEARAIAGTLAPSGSAMRDSAATAADALRHAEHPDVLRVADALGQTDAVLVIAPEGLTAIELGVLFPTAIELEAMGLGTGDVRGRAEELFATAIGTLALPARPIVVLVHGEDRPILDATHAFDYIRRRLGVRGIDLVEWACVVDPEPPVLTALDPDGDRPVVYTTLTPDSGTSSGGMNGVERAQHFADTLQSLIDRGAPLLLNLNVSVLPTYGTDDPIAGVLERLGLAADLGRPLLSERMTARGRLVQTDHVVRSLEIDHPIAGAVRGLNTKLTWPVPIDVNDGGAAVLYEIGGGAWAESEWVRLRRTPREQRPLLPDPPEFDAGRDNNVGPWAVVIAGERAHEDGAQRFVVVGSNDWAVDPVAGEAVSVDGVQRPANPGNAELFEAAVSWLAGQDDLIAESVSSRVVPTVRGLSDAQLAGVRWLVIAGLPGLVLAVGIAWRVLRG